MGAIEGTVVSKLAYYSNKPESVIAQSLYVVKPTYNFETVTYEDLKSKFDTGNKITHLFNMEDWIFGGNYFFGRHIQHLKKNSIFSPIPRNIIESYKIKYILDSDIYEGEKHRFFNDVIQNNNLIYSTKNLYLYDLKNGRRTI